MYKFHTNPQLCFCLCDTETTGLRTDNKDFIIEVGFIFVNNLLKVMNAFDSVVSMPKLIEILEDHHNSYWPEEFSEAYKVHNIDPGEILNYGREPAIIAKSIEEIIDPIKASGVEKIILISNNAAFDTHFLKQLYNASGYKWPFHYATWDTSIILNTANLNPTNYVHRAMPDALELLSNLVTYNNSVKGIASLYVPIS